MVTHEKYLESPYRAYTGDLQNLEDGATTVKVALMDDTFTIDRQNDSIWSDVDGSEIDPAANSGYTAGGQESTNKTISRDGNFIRFDGDNIVWNDSSINAFYAVVYIESGTDLDEALLTVVDFEGEEISSDGDFSIEWSATNGIFEVEVPEDV